jgi:RNA polymerase sigma factor (sigma-70 family)
MRERAIKTTRRVRNDEVVALGQRLISHRAQALRTARSLVGGQDAEDVLHEAIARVLGAAARGAVIEDPRAYLRTTVRHVASDHIHARRAESFSGVVPERRSRYADPQAAIELRELLTAIDDLPDRQRVALLTTALTARDQHHLAELLNTTSAGVRQLVRRARQRLHDTVGAWIPWLAVRTKDLVAAAGAGGAAHGAATMAAVAAVVIAAPTPPRPPHPPTPPRPSLAKASSASPQVRQPQSPHPLAAVRPVTPNP